MKITRMGIDLGKSAFHVYAVDRNGGVLRAFMPRSSPNGSKLRWVSMTSRNPS